MNVGCNAVFLQVAAQDRGIGSGNLFAIEPLQTIVAATFWNGKGEAALAEAERTHHFSILSPFLILVLAHNSKVGHTACHTLWDVVIAQIKHLDGEVTALH